MKNYIAAIDQGTTSTRCMIFTKSGEPKAVAQMEHEQIYPQPGWVEHNPMEIWENTKRVIHGAITSLGISDDEIAAVGITNQRETTLAWNRKTGKPYANAIVWQDTRTKHICDQLAGEGGPDRFRKKTGLPIATYFSGPKLKWMLEHIDGLREDAEAGEAVFGTIDTWLIWWLTGGPEGGAFVTDMTNASRTLMMNIAQLEWDPDMLSTLDIPFSMLPRIVPSADPATWGMTQPEGPFKAEIPVCGVLGDQQAALVGQACTRVGEAKNTYGTGCFMLLNTGEELVESNSGLITTVAYQFGESSTVYALEGSIAIAGALIQWLRDNLGIIETAPQSEELARGVEDNGGMYIVPAFSGLFAPYWRSDARGVMVGLTRYINKGHILRAALEATAYQTRDVLEAMVRDSGVDLEVLKVDGGMVHNDLLMQFQADILAAPVVRPEVTETTSLGAAYAAGLAVGFWKDLDELRDYWKEEKRWTPAMDSSRREKLYSGWNRAVERTFDWV
ncbi:MAG: glycerol kinase GlpK [Anaerolineales bacterium]